MPAEEWMREFMPYGTPCDDPCEPSRDGVERLEAELQILRGEIAELRAAQHNSQPQEPQQRSGTAD